MKQILVLFFLALFGINAAKATETPIPTAVLHSFFNTFKTAADVSWEQKSGFTVASFTINHHKQYAYYNEANELTIIAEPIAADQLPSGLQKELASMYKRYATVDIFKMVENGAITYSAIVENQKLRIILKSPGMFWEEAKLVKK